MSMYYGDLTETWSSFSLLVDNAVLLYEQEHKQTSEKKKTVSWKEEDEQRMKRIFDHFPRRPRRSWLKKPLQNLNGASTSSSSSSLVSRNMVETDETETTNPQNPRSRSSSSSCLTENTSRKRRAVQEGKRSFKKAKVSPLFSWEGKDTPDWMVQLMRSMKGGAQDAKLIFEKTLFETDVKPSQSRLSIPFNKLIRDDFLTAVESRIIEEDINNKEKMGLGALLVDQGVKKWGVFLKRWEMNGSWNYALVCGWNDVVKANGLKDGDNISLWSFRCQGVLCFALVPLPM
ncbi:putative B3 domain-containing protein [Raphanus sativus]|uniref:B3 domain-containing protein At3g25182 n=1 Tax=Raphanus sativus TaxID=3726 RepID=A0A6J0M0E7_RAPSA|nr:B3 domain-containing protein At3g25182 [Raphanus sativus]KAJ4866968.1 putative B3 domain-containing protein [Raphanus sativus]